MRVIFWGSPQFAVPPLEELAGSRHEVAAAVCQPDRPSGRGRKLAPPPVKQAAQKLGLPVLQPERPRGQEFLDRLAEFSADVSVVVAYGHILKPEVLAVPRHGSINLHASLLPAYRGAAPIQWAIARGDTTSGLTVIQMDEGMDTGPLLARLVLPIGPQESAGELAERMSRAGGPLLVETLDRLEAGTARPQPQAEEGVSYAPKIEHIQARIDWSREAAEVANLIRAFDPAPGAFCRRGEGVLKFFRPQVEEGKGRPGEIIESTKESLKVACGSGAVRVGEVQAEGKRRMTSAEYFRGQPARAGELLD